jgi:hypothetical protein
MGGAIIILFLMFIAGPIGIFAIGIVLSAALGWLFPATDADDRAAETPAASGS